MDSFIFALFTGNADMQTKLCSVRSKMSKSDFRLQRVDMCCVGEMECILPFIFIKVPGAAPDKYDDHWRSWKKTKHETSFVCPGGNNPFILNVLSLTDHCVIAHRKEAEYRTQPPEKPRSERFLPQPRMMYHHRCLLRERSQTLTRLYR